MGFGPGQEVSVPTNGRLSLNLQIQLISRDPIERLEVVHNGAVIHRLEVADAVQQQLQCDLAIEDHGWFLVRAIAQHPRTFRFASTGPFYLVSQGQPPRIRRSSVEFFQDWLEQRIERVTAGVSDSQQRAAVLLYQENARQFWRQRRLAANAD